MGGKNQLIIRRVAENKRSLYREKRERGKKGRRRAKKSNMGGEEVLETSTFDESSTPDAIPANSLMRESIREQISRVC